MSEIEYTNCAAPCPHCMATTRQEIITANRHREYLLYKKTWLPGRIDTTAVSICLTCGCKTWWAEVIVTASAVELRCQTRHEYKDEHNNGSRDESGKGKAD